MANNSDSKRKKGSGIPAGGMGWGGPPKGAHPTMALEDRARIWQAMTPDERRLRKAMRAVQNEDHLDRLAEATKTMPLVVPASMAFATLTGLKPAEKQELTGAGGLPLAVDRPPPETREEWLERRTREAAGSLDPTTRTPD